MGVGDRLRVVIAILMCVSVGVAGQVYQANAGSPSQMVGQSMLNTSNATDFDVEVYVLENGNLVKRHINQSILRKALVVFIGEGCPHCEKFLSGFAQHYKRLTSEGVTVVFVRIPAIDALQAGRVPTMQEYESAASETSVVSSPSNTVKVFLLADYPALMKVGVTAIPVGFIVDRGAQRLKMEGDALIQKTDFSDDSVLQSFLEYYTKDDESNRDEGTTKIGDHDNGSRKTGAKGSRNSGTSSSRHRGINLDEARKYTQMLNDCNCDDQSLCNAKNNFPPCFEKWPDCYKKPPACPASRTPACFDNPPVCEQQPSVCGNGRPAPKRSSVCGWPLENQEKSPMCGQSSANHEKSRGCNWPPVNQEKSPMCGQSSANHEKSRGCNWPPVNQEKPAVCRQAPVCEKSNPKPQCRCVCDAD
ncbi:MAG: hypothetical protein LBF65_01275 [Holosporales bacterium]|jgi:hypothetical protein|nr:hypothetical protein [Holosporales bacterium]